MTNWPLVTYVVPVFNRENTLPRLLSSIICQTYRPLEIVLVDDGSNDCSWSVIQEFTSNSARQDCHVVPHRQEHLGVSAARNAGMAFASGDLIGFLDSDDWIPAGRTMALVEALEYWNADLCFGNHTDKLSNLTPSGELSSVDPGTADVRVPGPSFPLLKLVPLVVSFLADNRIVQSAGQFSVDLSVMEDFEWVVRLKSHARKIVKIPDNVYVQINTDRSLIHTHLRAFDQRILAEAKMLTTIVPFWSDERLGRGLARRRLIRLGLRSGRAFSGFWFLRSIALIMCTFCPSAVARIVAGRLATVRGAHDSR